MSEETPIWQFDKVRITYLKPIIKDDGMKSTVSCHASIDFGFFHIFDIGITKFNDGLLAWSNDFGWSQFRFNSSQIDNPYGEEVTKLMRMIKDELGRKRSKIIGFLDNPHTMPEIIKEVDA